MNNFQLQNKFSSAKPGILTDFLCKISIFSTPARPFDSSLDRRPGPGIDIKTGAGAGVPCLPPNPPPPPRPGPAAGRSPGRSLA